MSVSLSFFRPLKKSPLGSLICFSSIWVIFVFSMPSMASVSLSLASIFKLSATNSGLKEAESTIMVSSLSSAFHVPEKLMPKGKWILNPSSSPFISAEILLSMVPSALRCIFQLMLMLLPFSAITESFCHSPTSVGALSEQLHIMKKPIIATIPNKIFLMFSLH